MSESFFSKEKIHNFVWFLIGAFVLFICGFIWTSIYGPDEVKVISDSNSIPDTTVTIFKIESENELNSIPANNLNRTQLDSIIRKTIAEEYKEELALATNEENSESINENLNNPKTTIPPASLSQDTRNSQGLGTNLEAVYVDASIKRPRFKLPKVVEGYTKGNLNSYGKIYLNKREFSQEDVIVLGLELFDSEIIDKITPVFVELLEKKSENTYYKHWSEQYEIEGLKNRIRFSAEFPKKQYELTISFYFRSETNQKFPRRYSKKFDIKII